jgi:hypothetical protein
MLKEAMAADERGPICQKTILGTWKNLCETGLGL